VSEHCPKCGSRINFGCENCDSEESERNAAITEFLRRCEEELKRWDIRDIIIDQLRIIAKEMREG